MDTLGQELLEELDDTGFCQCLLSIIESAQRDSGTGLGMVYEDWVLARLRQIHRHHANVFYGLFLTPLQGLFPGRQVWPQFILDAMQGVTTQTQADSGDVPPSVLIERMRDLALHGPPPTLHPGWESLAPYYTIRRGEFTVITGVSNHMKSAFVNRLCLNLARHYGWHFSLFTPEHDPLEELSTELMEAYLDQPEYALSDEDRAHGQEWIADRFHFIEPLEEVQPTLAWILAVARLQKQRYGIHGLVIDPWNMIDHCYGRETETKYISACLSQIGRFARAQDMHVWILAHPTKLKKAEKGPYEGHYPPPTPYDISGSADWYNKPYNCLSIWRNVPEDSLDIEVHVQKVKRRKVGHVGKIDLRFDGRRFHDLGAVTSAHWTER